MTPLVPLIRVGPSRTCAQRWRRDRTARNITAPCPRAERRGGVCRYARRCCRLRTAACPRRGIRAYCWRTSRLTRLVRPGVAPPARHAPARSSTCFRRWLPFVGSASLSAFEHERLPRDTHCQQIQVPLASRTRSPTRRVADGSSASAIATSAMMSDVHNRPIRIVAWPPASRCSPSCTRGPVS